MIDSKLMIGDNCRNSLPKISVSNSVIIGNNCRITPHVIIMDSDFHQIADLFSEAKPAGIVLKDDVWLSTRSMVLKSVTIGKGAVVAAGAVIAKDVEAYTVVGEVPAKFIKRIEKN